MGLLFKSKEPKIWAQADTLGFILLPRRRLRVRLHWGRSWHQKMEREFVGCVAEACNKMVLVGLDAPFSSIGSVHASRGSLELDSFFIHVFF